MTKTSRQYDNVVEKCRNIFLQKNRDYGTSWRVLRLESLTDQMFIKARRIRTLEESKEQKINEGIEGEYRALVNYGIMALMQCYHDFAEEVEIPFDKVSSLYQEYISKTKDLMLAKNHDYGEVWRDMRISSMTDLILVKLLRIKQIEDNDGNTMASEGVDSNYMDIINYAIFALIKLEEGKDV